MKKTLILGATPNPERYAFRAAKMLVDDGHVIFPVGIKKGQVQGVDIQQEIPVRERIHTVTLYVNPSIQKDYYKDLMALNPSRIIFNPGTENDELRKMAQNKGIVTEYACTLVMISTGVF